MLRQKPMTSPSWILTLLAIVCSVAGCFSAGDDTDPGGDSSTQRTTVADTTFYSCQTATKDKSGNRIAWEIDKFNNTMDRIQV